MDTNTAATKAIEELKKAFPFCNVDMSEILREVRETGGRDWSFMDKKE